MGNKMGKQKYKRNKKTGEVFRFGAFSSRRSHRTLGRVDDGFMSGFRHERNKKRE